MPRKQNRFSRRSRKIKVGGWGKKTYCCRSNNEPCRESITGQCVGSLTRDDGTVLTRYICATTQPEGVTDAVLNAKVKTRDSSGECEIVRGPDESSGTAGTRPGGPSLFTGMMFTGGKKKTRNHKSKKNKSKRAKK